MSVTVSLMLGKIAPTGIASLHLSLNQFLNKNAGVHTWTSVLSPIAAAVAGHNALWDI